MRLIFECAGAPDPCRALNGDRDMTVCGQAMPRRAARRRRGPASIRSRLNPDLHRGA